MKKIFLILTAFFTIAGCSDFLDVDVPKDQVDQTKAFFNDEMAVSALTHVYTSMRNIGFLAGDNNGAGVLLGAYTDELESVSSSMPAHRYFYDMNLTSSNEAVKVLWNQTYHQIYIANNVIEGLEKSQGISEQIKDQLTGEALAVRGILHFYLSQTFGDVPYIVGTDYLENSKVEKLSSDKVYGKATADLLLAEKLVSEAYPGAEKVRPNKAVVQAFLARMFLYNQDWVMAQEYAEKVIAKDTYQLESVENVFLKESKSAIWQFKPSVNGANTTEAYAHIFTTVPPPNFKLAADLIHSFSKDDLRRKSWIQMVDEDMLLAHASKYRVRGTSTPSKEYSIVMRLEEMYLVSAETAAQLSQWNLYNTRINALRVRANISQLQIENRDQALDTIYAERRREFFCEYGHRFYDLKRTDRLLLLKAVKPQWQNYFKKLPIPLNELILNPNLLPQNEGY